MKFLFEDCLAYLVILVLSMAVTSLIIIAAHSVTDKTEGCITKEIIKSTDGTRYCALPIKDNQYTLLRMDN